MAANANTTHGERDIWTDVAAVVLIVVGFAGLLGWKTDPADAALRHAALRQRAVCDRVRTVQHVDAEMARLRAEIARRQAQRALQQLRAENPL